MSAAGRFFWTPHAVQRAVERLWPKLGYDAALGRLVEAAETAVELRQWRGGREVATGVLWRASNRYGRFRFVVGMAAGPGLPPVLTVLGPYDGWRPPC